MSEDLEFLKGEATKLQKAIRKDDAKNYKRYGTLFQAYLTARGNVQQLEAYKRQQEEERKRKEENENAFEEAKKQLEKENK